MNIYNSTQKIMSKYNIRANKKYGQNFLIDDVVLNNIAEVSEITKEDLVIEIGPGLGNLTAYILDRAKFGLLIEIDKKMIDVLNDRFSEKNNYLLLNEDVLKIDINEIIRKIKKENNLNFRNIKVVANLPYYITTPILFKLLENLENISSITVMVQKEVAQRMVAIPKSKDFGILTLMIKYYCEAKIEFIVPNTAFIPAPDVTSAVVNLRINKKYIVKNEEILFELIHKAFAQRRKKMINSLQATGFNNMEKLEIEALLKKCNIDINARAEELDLEDYINIVNCI